MITTKAKTIDWVKDYGEKYGPLLQEFEQKFKKVFDKFDKNKDGYIDLEKEAKAYSRTVKRALMAKDEQVKEMIEQFDKDKDRKISWEEFREGWILDTVKAFGIENVEMFLEPKYMLLIGELEPRGITPEELFKLAKNHLIELFEVMDEKKQGYIVQVGQKITLEDFLEIHRQDMYNLVTPQTGLIAPILQANLITALKISKREYNKKETKEYLKKVEELQQQFIKEFTRVIETYEGKFKKIFEKFDLDKDGFLADDEKTAYTAMLAVASGDADFAKQLTLEMDRDKDGKLSWKEFRDGWLVDMIHVLQIEETLEIELKFEPICMVLLGEIETKAMALEDFFNVIKPKIIEMFKIMDDDKDGQITVHDIINCYRDPVLVKVFGIDDESIASIFTSLGKKIDEKISLDEYLKFQKEDLKHMISTTSGKIDTSLQANTIVSLDVCIREFGKKDKFPKLVEKVKKEEPKKEIIEDTLD